MALLHMLWSGQAQLGIEVCAAHLDHGLRGAEAERDARFVESWCRERAIPCLTERADTAAYAREEKLGLEEAARALRYAFLERAADALGCDRIATAHNADDNAETILFHLLRGSGGAGLCGIPRERGRVVRPLLDTTRAEIERYLRENRIEPMEDGSNRDEHFARNRLRLRVMPVLRQLNPRVSEAMGRTARLLARDEAYLTQEAASFLAGAFDGERVSLPALRALPEAVAARAVRLLWPASLSCEQTEDVLAFIRGSERGYLDLPGGRLRRERGWLYLSGEDTLPPLPDRLLRPGRNLAVPEAGLVIRSEVLLKREEIHGLFKTYELKYESIKGEILCTGRRDGDRFRPAGRGCTKSLKALFAEAGLSLRERGLVPVLRDEEGILAVLGFGWDERCSAGPGETVLRLGWYDE